MLNRRSLLALFSGLFASSRAKGSEKILAGAIRWDAWYGRHDAAANAQMTLSDPRFVARAPVHCEVAESAQVQCVGTQEIMDAEIQAANNAGLSHWAFCWFPAETTFRTAWNLYQESVHKEKIHWCPILPAEALGSFPFRDESWIPKVHQWVEYMKQSHFFKVSGGRPLVYLYYRQEEFERWFGGADFNVRHVIQRMRDECRIVGLGDPYVVVFNPSVDRSLVTRLGADATSNYISGFARRRHGTFAELAYQTRRYWLRMASSGLEVVPIVLAGWDVRPRINRPVPWENRLTRDPDFYYQIATPSEFAAHIAEAVNFVRMRPQVCPKKLVLIYSWSECDEGGCIMPTKGDPRGALLDAVKTGLQ